MSKVKIIFKSYSAAITPRLNETYILVKQFMDAYGLYTEEQLRTKVEFVECFQKSLEIQTWYMKTIERMSEEKEGKLIDEKLLALAIQSFVFCIVALIIGGFVEDDVLKSHEGLRLLGNINLASLMSSVALTFVVSKWREAPVRCALVSIAVTTLIVIGFQFFPLWSLPEVWIISGSFGICMLPLVITLARIISWRFFRVVNIKMRSNDKFIAKHSAMMEGLLANAYA